jgi:hypothetical protein
MAKGITNISRPILRTRPLTLMERGKITGFLKNPCLKNLPQPIKTRVIDGKVYLCVAPDGRRIFLETKKYNSAVVLTVRYENGNIYAELQTEPMLRAAAENPANRSYPKETYLIKEGNKIHHAPKIIDPKDLVSGKKAYKYPRFQSKAPARMIESWLRGNAGLPFPCGTRANREGDVQPCSYRGEAVLLPLGAEYAGEAARLSFEQETEGDKLKWIIVDIEDIRFEFALTCKKGTCYVRDTLGPYLTSNTHSFPERSLLLGSYLRFLNLGS